MPSPSVSVVAGGGLSGLVAALLLSEGRRPGRVMVVESSGALGGLHRGFDYGKHGRFDQGAHYFQETKIRELDELLFGLLPAGQWDRNTGVRRDIGGVFFGGVLQRNSPYVDLRNLGKPAFEECRRQLLHCQRRGAASPRPRSRRAQDYVLRRFGRAVADAIMTPILRKMYGLNLSELDAAVFRVLPLSRLVALDERAYFKILGRKAAESAVAYPEQRNFPLGLSSGKGTFYPKRFGTQTLIDALRRRLEERGVEILTGCSIEAVSAAAGRVRGVRIVSRRGRVQEVGVESLIWAAGIEPLADLLGIERRPYRRTAAAAVFVHFIFREKPLAGDLYYVFCFEPGFMTYRVANYWSYASGARRAGGYPLTVEMLARPGESRRRRGLKSAALAELQRMGLVAADAAPVFSAVEPVAVALPFLGLERMDEVRRLRAKIKGMGLKNLVRIGLFSEEGLFMASDVLADAFRKMQALRRDEDGHERHD